MNGGKTFTQSLPFSARQCLSLAPASTRLLQRIRSVSTGNLPNGVGKGRRSGSKKGCVNYLFKETNRTKVIV